MKRKFQDLAAFTIDDIDAALTRNDPGELVLLSITVALSFPDLALAQEVCARLSTYEDPKIRGNAVAALGHLARRFRKLDDTRVKAIIESALQDADEYVRVHAKSAADEIHQFLGWDIEGHVYGV
jgi:hypothetical protein